jgi:hypothetical protein
LRSIRQESYGSCKVRAELAAESQVQHFKPCTHPSMKILTALQVHLVAVAMAIPYIDQHYITVHTLLLNYCSCHSQSFQLLEHIWIRPCHAIPVNRHRKSHSIKQSVGWLTYASTSSRRHNHQFAMQISAETSMHPPAAQPTLKHSPTSKSRHE